jgi:hypothetical protein
MAYILRGRCVLSSRHPLHTGLPLATAATLLAPGSWSWGSLFWLGSTWPSGRVQSQAHAARCAGVRGVSSQVMRTSDLIGWSPGYGRRWCLAFPVPQAARAVGRSVVPDESTSSIILQGASGWRRRVAEASPRLLASRLRSLNTEVGVVARCVLSSPRQKKGGSDGHLLWCHYHYPPTSGGRSQPSYAASW